MPPPPDPADQGDTAGVLLDFLQNIVNVSWDDGLAVEFYPGDT